MAGDDPITSDASTPAEATHALALTPREVGFDAPLRWLAAGWRDFRATGYRGAFYGIVFALMGIAIASIYATRWELTLALVAGFFLVGPFVCTGLYELSRQRELDRRRIWSPVSAAGAATPVRSGSSRRS